MNALKIVDDILQREKAGDPTKGYLAPNDAGGRTNWGISERAHPEAWRNGPPTREQAATLLLQVYVKPFFPLAALPGADPLIECLIDDAVMSGVHEAVLSLQYVLGVHADGVLGSQTIDAIKAQLGDTLLKKYVSARIIREIHIVQRRPADLTNLAGWVTRVLGFLP